MSVTALPAPPLLGSNILAAARAHENTRPTPASSGSVALDEGALSGGFRYGEITSIAGASGTGKTLVSLNKVLLSGVFPHLYCISMQSWSFPFQVYTLVSQSR